MKAGHKVAGFGRYGKVTINKTFVYDALVVHDVLVKDGVVYVVDCFR